MKSVHPEVYLVARPAVDWHSLQRFLSHIDAGEWLDRIDNQLLSGAQLSEGEILVEVGGRECYRSWTPGLNPNVVKVRESSSEYLKNIVASGHGSVLEHANYSFIFHNVSRVFTHEMVRHRAGAAYSQESMRYVRLDDLPFWFSDWAKADEELMSRCIDLLYRMEAHQQWMSEHFGLDDEGVPFEEKKHKTSFMRRFAPDGVATGMLCTMNVRTLRHVIAMRTALPAEEEIRLVMDEVAKIMLNELPNLMADYDRNENAEWVPSFLKV